MTRSSVSQLADEIEREIRCNSAACPSENECLWPKECRTIKGKKLAAKVRALKLPTATGERK